MEVISGDGQEVFDGNVKLTFASDDLEDVRALVEVRSEGFSDEALLDDGKMVIEDAGSLFFTTAMQVDVAGEHL